MEIVPYTSDRAQAVADSYRRAFVEGSDGSGNGAIPFCYPVSTALLADPASLSCDNHAQLHHDLVLVALDGRRVVGYAHAASEEPKPADQRDWDDYDTPQGVLRMFWYERGHRAAGEALLARAEGHVRALGMPRIEVMHSKRRYLWHHLPHMHLTQRAEHLHGLLLARGYARDKANVALAWEHAVDAPVAPCALPHTLRREEEACPGDIPRVLLFAEQEGEWRGMCVGGSLAETQADPRARDWMYIHWLISAEEVRGQGLAKHLLTAMFQEMKGYGARHAAICCIEENTPALLLYANVGFRSVDFSYSYVRAFS